jgi:hypothetical protein
MADTLLEPSVINQAPGDARTPSKLKLDRSFRPVSVDAGDEILANGIFEFNITRLLAFIHIQPERFPVEAVDIADIPSYGDGSHLDQGTVDSADVLRPVLLAEISPGNFSLIDGHHRIARARRDGLAHIPACRVHCPDHVAFLTSAHAYESYVHYWNSKLTEDRPRLRRRRSRAL